MAPKVAIIIYSLYHHVAQLAEAEKAGVEAAGGVANGVAFVDWLGEHGRDVLALKPAAAPILLHGHCHQKAFGAVSPILDVLRLMAAGMTTRDIAAELDARDG